MIRGKISAGFKTILCAIIGLILFTGCGTKTKEDETNVDKVNNSIEALLNSENFKLTRSSSLTIGGITSDTVKEVTFNNNNNEGYIASFMVEEGEQNLYSEVLVVDENCYMRGQFQRDWINYGEGSMEGLVGLEDILSIDISPEDCKDIKKITKDGNESISVVASSNYLKKFKNKTIEKFLNNSEENSSPSEEVKNEFNKLKEKINYKSINYIFCIDKSGALTGLKADYILEMPYIDTTPKVGEEMYNITSVSDITVESYNDNHNEKIIEEFKSQLNK